MENNYHLTLDDCEMDDLKSPMPDTDIIDVPDKTIIILAGSILKMNEKEEEKCHELMKTILKQWREGIANNIKRESRYIVKSKEELRKLIKYAVSVNPNADLNWINVSNISDMSFLFWESSFNGDISEWDVSNVENMFEMFYASDFNGDLSMWDVSNVKNMKWMFLWSKYSQDIHNWVINDRAALDGVFLECPIPECNKPKALQKIITTK